MGQKMDIVIQYPEMWISQSNEQTESNFAHVLYWEFPY